MAYLSGYTTREELVIDSSKVHADLTDYVVYVDLADLSSQFWSTVKSDGTDIRVTKSDGTTEVPLEVVDIDTTAETGELHFKADGTLSSSSDTTFYIYYNGTSSGYAVTDTYGRNAVWSDYEVVYHMNESSGSTVVDSSGNGDGTWVGSNVPNRVAFALGYGQQVDDSSHDGGISAADIGFSNTTDFTISVWQRFDNVANQGNIVFDWRGETDVKAFGDRDLLRFQEWDGGTNRELTMTITAGTEYLFHFVKEQGVKKELYANTIKEDSDSWNGTRVSASRTYNGVLLQSTGNTTTKSTADEFRVHFGIRSTDWITTEYNNQNSPSTFYTATAESDSGGGSARRVFIIS